MGKRPQRNSTELRHSLVRQGSGLTPAYLWKVFSQWWKWVVPAGILLAVSAAVLVTYLHVPEYEGAALIQIESEGPFVAFEDGAFRRSGDSYVQTQIELLRGPVVLAPVLGRPEIASITEIKRSADPLKFLQKQLNVSQVGRSELYRVSFLSPSPQDATTVANIVVEEYLKRQDREEKLRSRIVIEVLEKERLERDAKVQQLRRRVVDLSKDLTGKDPFGQGVVMDISAFSPVASLHQSLTEAEVNLEVLKAELESLKKAPILAADMAAASGLLELEISNRPDIRQIAERIGHMEEAMTVIQMKPRPKIGDSWENDPDYLRLQEQAADTRVQLKELKESVKKELLELRFQERKIEQDRLIAAKKQEMETINSKRELLLARFNDHLQSLKSGGAQSAELEFAKAELEREQRVFELIAARKLALQTETNAPPRVSVMRSATAPTTPVELVPYKLLVLAVLVALLAPLALATGHDLIVRRISSPEQLMQEALLPVLGEISRFPMRQVTSSQLALSAPRQRELYIFAESIDSLRTNLSLTENLGAPGSRKVIAICSAASGEGKTSVATSLAMSIAKATRQPTLIIDADLRSPDVAELLEVPMQPGMAEVLTGECAVEQAIHRVGISQAYVMPGGKRRVNPHQMTTGTAIGDLLSVLRDKFATIVVDTPPVLCASESLVYARAADLVVFCSLAEVSRVKHVQVAVEKLQTTGANVAGAVLSGVPVNRYVSHYGYYSQDR